MVGEGAFGELQLAQQDGAGLGEALDDRRIVVGPEVLVDRHAGGGRNALGVAEVLHRDRHAVQRPAIGAAPDLGLGLARLLQREVGGDGGVALQPAVEFADALQHGLGQRDRRERAHLDAARDVEEVEIVKVLVAHCFLASNADAAWINRASSKWRPTSIKPTGSPSFMPQGMVKAGWPLTSKGQVLACMLSARST